MPTYPVSGVKVITPELFTTYEPTPFTVIVVPGVIVQFGETSAGLEFGSHNRRVVASKFVLVPAALTVFISLLSKLTD